MKIDPAIIDFALWNAAVRSPQDRLILLAVGRWRRIWKEVTPSVKYIASEVGVSERHTRTILKRLSDEGMINVTERRSRGSQATNRYDIDPKGCIACIPEHRLATLRNLLQYTDCTPSSQQTAQPAPKTRTRENSKQEQLLIAEIYEAYPRHIGKARAIEKIGIALGKIEATGMTVDEAASHLLSKTREFASSLAGQRGVYTPHPSTWFNQERYTDDPAEWDRPDKSDRGNNRPDETSWGDSDEHLSGIKVT